MEGLYVATERKAEFLFGPYCFVEKLPSDLLGKLNLRGKFFNKIVRAVSGTKGCELTD